MGYETEEPPDPMVWHPVTKKEYQSHQDLPMPQQFSIQDNSSMCQPAINPNLYSNPNINPESNPWNPFPDPDAGLPRDLYEIHQNQWLRSQYQLWLQKVQENKALVEQYYFQK